jgi:hypothetical protein
MPEDPIPVPDDDLADLTDEEQAALLCATGNDLDDADALIEQPDQTPAAVPNGFEGVA